jgi:TRAP-type mannitol/chloroaromatic compound transport system substrate-binding protein
MGQSHSPSGNFKTDRLEALAEKITTTSGGRLVLKLHPGGAIVPASEEFDGVHEGLLDWAEVVPSYWSDKFPMAGLFSFTVAGLSPIEQLLWMLEGDGLELCERMIEGYNVKIIPGTFYPPESFLWSTKPLKTVDDIKGLKIRTAGDDGEIFAQMGAAVVFVPGGEVYEAVQRGVIDAFQLGSPSIDITLGVHEVAEYCYLSPVRQPLDWHFLGINSNRWAELTPYLQELVENVYLAMSMKTYAMATKQDIEGITTLKDYGTVVEPASKEIEDELIRQAKIFYDKKAAEDPLAAEVLQSMRDWKKAYGEAFARL